MDRVEDSLGAFDRDAVVLISLVARNDGLGDVERLRELPLSHSARDPKSDELAPKVG